MWCGSVCDQGAIALALIVRLAVEITCIAVLVPIGTIWLVGTTPITTCIVASGIGALVANGFNVVIGDFAINTDILVITVTASAMLFRPEVAVAGFYSFLEVGSKDTRHVTIIIFGKVAWFRLISRCECLALSFTVFTSQFRRMRARCQAVLVWILVGVLVKPCILDAFFKAIIDVVSRWFCVVRRRIPTLKGKSHLAAKLRKLDAGIFEIFPSIGL